MVICDKNYYGGNSLFWIFIVCVKYFYIFLIEFWNCICFVLVVDFKINDGSVEKFYYMSDLFKELLYFENCLLVDGSDGGMK